MIRCYLEDHPPARSQYRTPRRALVTGAIVVHSAENTTDLTLPDSGAEGVARFISRRTDAAGSYHSVVDSDSRVKVGRYDWEMFGEGTGGNRWALHLSFACQADQWPTLPKAWSHGALRQGAAEAADMNAWVRATFGVSIPARRITPAQYRAGQPGFIGHGELDPGRRSDPGAEFPWDDFLTYYQMELTMPDAELLSLPGSISLVMGEVEELYRIYRGVPPSPEERMAWGRDLAHKIFVSGDDTHKTLAYIEYALRTERK